MLLFGIVVLASSVFLALKGSGNAGALKHWVTVVVTFVLGVGAIIGGYFYATYSLTVTHDSITISHPFRGTQILTRHNIISVGDSYFKGVRLLEVTYRDHDRVRKIRFDRARFDMTAFFGSRG